MRTFELAAIACVLHGGVLLGQTIRTDGENLVVSLYPSQTGDTGSPVRLSAKGKVFDGRAKEGTPDPDVEKKIQFINVVVNANRSSNEANILRLWSDTDQPDIRKKLADARLAEANRSMYGRIQASRLLAVINYGPYVLLFVRHAASGTNSFFHTYPVIGCREGLCLTNALRDDRVFSCWSGLIED